LWKNYRGFKNLMALTSLITIAYACTPSVAHPFLNRLRSSDTGLRLARGVFWTMAGTVISRGLMLCATVLVARILGKTVYGELGMIQSTVGMFGVLAGFGLGVTATKHVAEFRRTDPERTGRIIGLSGLFAMGAGGLIALGLLIFAPWLAENTINAPHLSGILRLSAIILFINALNGAQTGALSGFEAFKAIAYVNLFIGLISFPILVCGAYLGGLTGAVWGLTINLCFNWILNHLALRKEAKRGRVPFTFKNCSCEWPILWKFSLPAALNGALVGPVNWACGALLVNQPGGYAEMGIYNVANQWRMAILFIPSILGQVTLPLLTNLNAALMGNQYQKVLKLNLLLNFSITFLTILPLISIAHSIMSMYGSGFDEGVNVFRILLLSTVLVSVNNVIGQVIISRGKMWVGFVFNGLWAVILVTTTYILIRLGYKSDGLAYATLIAYIFHTIWQGMYMKYTLQKNINQ